MKNLKTLYLIGTYVLKETNKYKLLLKQQQDIIYNLLQNMKYEKQIIEDADKMNQNEPKEGGGLDFSSLGDLFDENNIITQIALEIAKEINLSGGIGSDPMQAIRMLMGQDSQKLQEIIGRVQQKLTTVLREKGVTESQLVQQAELMKDKVFSKLKGIPGLENIEKLGRKFAEDMEKMKTTQEPVAQAQTGSTIDKEIHEKEQLEKCQSVIQELTNSLKKNLMDMGINDLNELSLTSAMHSIASVKKV